MAEQPNGQNSSQGAIDWDAFFEQEPNGIIPLVTSAKSASVLTQCSVVVVESIFSRDRDEELRQSFLELLRGAIPPPDAPSEEVDRAKEKLVKVFHHIKEDRKARAAAFAEIAAEAEEEERRMEEEETAEVVVDENDPKRVFSREVWAVIRERLDLLQLGSSREELEKIRSPLPFFLSNEFIEHFGRIVQDDIAPLAAEKAKTLVRNIAIYNGEQLLEKAKELVNDPANRPVLWEAWKFAWNERTQQQEIPRKPSQTQQSSGGGLFKKKKPAYMIGKAPELTIEQWKVAAKKVRIANKRAERIWEEILAPSEDYDPPIEEDNTFLMELLGRSPAAMTKQINALRQIASQGGEIGRAYDTFRRNKHPDLAMVAVCFRHPDLFLDERKQILKAMLRGYSEKKLHHCMPLTTRYFGMHLI